MRTVDEMMREIDDAVAPDEMSPKEALDWIETLIEELEMRVEGLRADLAR